MSFVEPTLPVAFTVRPQMDFGQTQPPRADKVHHLGFGSVVSARVSEAQPLENQPQVEHQVAIGPFSTKARSYISVKPQEAEPGQEFRLVASVQMPKAEYAPVLGRERTCHSKLMPAPKAGNWMKSYGSWNGLCRAVIRSTGRNLGGGVLRF